MNKIVWRLLTHATIVMALFMGTLCVLDQLNPLMGFLNNGIAKAAVMLFCLLSFVHGLLSSWVQCGAEEVSQ